MHWLLGLALATAAVAGGAVPPISFAAPREYPAGPYPSFTATGDWNHDGIPDLAIANSGGYSAGPFRGHTISVLLGKGNGTFRSPVHYQVGMGPKFIASADFNGDGNPDLAVANITSGDVSILLGSPDGTFQPQAALPGGGSPTALTVGDFNGDGKPDLAAAIPCAAGGACLSIWLGNGDGSFQAPVSYSGGAEMARAIVTGDFNGDGVLDLALAGGNLAIFLGKLVQRPPSIGSELRLELFAR